MSESNSAEFYKKSLPQSNVINILLVVFMILLIGIFYFALMYYGSSMSNEMTKKELQIRPNKQLQQLRVEESEKLNQPIAWKDSSKTKVKIPIELAMQAVVRKYAK